MKWSSSPVITTVEGQWDHSCAIITFPLGCSYWLAITWKTARNHPVQEWKQNKDKNKAGLMAFFWQFIILTPLSQQVFSERDLRFLEVSKHNHSDALAYMSQQYLIWTRGTIDLILKAITCKRVPYEQRTCPVKSTDHSENLFMLSCCWNDNLVYKN